MMTIDLCNANQAREKGMVSEIRVSIRSTALHFRNPMSAFIFSLRISGRPMLSMTFPC